MEYCQKLTSWDIYGVRKFPYPGRRKYSPDVNRSFFGIITITNDVFGLTIFQFEREFKACLRRRQQHEQRILNIRYPDKSSNGYLEYLRYGDDTIEDQTLPEAWRSYQNIVQVAGTELEIRTRQRMFNVIDKVKSSLHHTYPRQYISSGSLAEGIDLKGSDIDIMFELTDVTVIQHLKYLNKSNGQTTFLMEQDPRYPGFCKLKLVAVGYIKSECVMESVTDSQSGVYLSADSFIKLNMDGSQFRHGPCISDSDEFTDIAYCFRSKLWPANAMNWIYRHRFGQWPSENVIKDIVSDGCLFVPIGPKNAPNEYSTLLWRISFSLAEKRLSHSLNYTQMLCYIILKLTLKNIINKHANVKDLLCSYFLKTALYWLSEEICIETFKITNLSYCFALCIDKLMLFLRNCYCPNYFIPEHNMFIGKFDESNTKLLLSILSELRNTEFRIIIYKVMDNNNHFIRSITNKNILSLNLDIVFFRILVWGLITSVDVGYKTLQYIESVMESETSEFILHVLKYYHGVVSQQIPQLINIPKRRCKCGCVYNIMRSVYSHLNNGTQTDAASGWLLYASFYYAIGQYKHAVQIVNNVLSSCTPDMISLSLASYTTEERNKYKHKTKSHLTLNHRMRHATVIAVMYLPGSTLIPQELYFLVQDYHLYVSPIVLCHCLQFLSYHHLGDINNKHRALLQLCQTIQEAYFVMKRYLSISTEILCACCKLSGDRDTVYCCVKHCTHDLCLSARKTIMSKFPDLK